MPKLGAITIPIGAYLDPRSWSKASRSMRRWGRQMALSGRELTMGVTLPIVGIGTAALKSFKDIENLQTGLKQVTKNNREYLQQWAEIRKLAKLPAVGLEEATRVSQQVQLLGGNFAFAKGIVEEFANAVALGGGGTENFNRAMTQLVQTLAKGKVEEQDWKIIRENALPVQKAMAAAFGTTDKNAILATRSVGQFYIELVQAMRGLERAEETFQVKWDNIRDTVTLALAEIGKRIYEDFNLGPFLDKLSDALERFVKWLTDLPETQFKLLVGGFSALAAIGPALVIAGNGALLWSATLGGLAKVVTAGGKAWAMIAGAGALKQGAKLTPAALARGGGIVGVIVALGIGMRYAFNETEKFTQAIDKLAQKLGSGALAKMSEWFSKNAKLIKPFLVGAGASFLDFGMFKDMWWGGREKSRPQGRSAEARATPEIVDPVAAAAAGILPSWGEMTFSGGGGDKPYRPRYDVPTIPVNRRGFKASDIKKIFEVATPAKIGSKFNFFKAHAVTQMAGAGQGIKPDVDGRSFEDKANDVMRTMRPLFDSMNMIFDIFNMGIDAQMTKLEQRYERERELILNSLMTEEEKQKALIELEKKTDKKRQELERKKARRQKAQAIFNATVQGAQAVIAAIASAAKVSWLSAPLAAGIVGALVAAQIAAIAAAPLPFAKGGIVHGETFAQIGEYTGARNNPEVVAPLNKLKEYMGTGKDVNVVGRMYVSGDDLYGVIENENKNRESSGAPYFPMQ